VDMGGMGGAWRRCMRKEAVGAAWVGE